VVDRVAAVVDRAVARRSVRRKSGGRIFQSVTYCLPFELRAALTLTKLYQLTARPAEAHAVLAPALDGFAPTSQMPEIAEAQEMIAAIEAGPHL
jgi:hypothetical protein